MKSFLFVLALLPLSSWASCRLEYIYDPTAGWVAAQVCRDSDEERPQTRRPTPMPGGEPPVIINDGPIRSSGRLVEIGGGLSLGVKSFQMGGFGTSFDGFYLVFQKQMKDGVFQGSLGLMDIRDEWRYVNPDKLQVAFVKLPEPYKYRVAIASKEIKKKLELTLNVMPYERTLELASELCPVKALFRKCELKVGEFEREVGLDQLRTNYSVSEY